MNLKNVSQDNLNKSAKRKSHIQEASKAPKQAESISNVDFSRGASSEELHKKKKKSVAGEFVDFYLGKRKV